MVSLKYKCEAVNDAELVVQFDVDTQDIPDARTPVEPHCEP